MFYHFTPPQACRQARPLPARSRAASPSPADTRCRFLRGSVIGSPAAFMNAFYSFPPFELRGQARPFHGGRSVSCASHGVRSPRTTPWLRLCMSFVVSRCRLPYLKPHSSFSPGCALGITLLRIRFPRHLLLPGLSSGLRRCGLPASHERLTTCAAPQISS